MSLSTMIGAPHSPLHFPSHSPSHLPVRGFGAFHAPAPRPSALRFVAALPFRNHTGRDALVWVEFCMAAMLNRELEAQQGLSVLPLVDVVTALKESGDGPPGARAIEQVRALGARSVIAAQVHSHESGFELRYQLHGDLTLVDSSPLHGSDLTQLTIALGQKLARELVDRVPTRVPTDTFTSEAFTRAMHAAREQRYQMAQDYLQVCAASQPLPLEMEVEHVESLAAIEHPETVSKAQSLLASAAASADVATQARVLRALAAYYRALENNELARTLIHQALTLLETNGDEALKAAVLLERCELAIADREFELAQSVGRRVLAGAQAGDHDRLTAQRLRQEGVIAHLRGQAELALEILHRSAQLSRSPHPQHAELAGTLYQTAIICRDAGRMRDAAIAIDEAVHCAKLAGTPVRHALTLAFQLMVHSYAGNQAAADAAQATLASAPMQQSRAGRFLSQLTQAWLYWRNGRIADALQRMEQVRKLGRDARHFWLSFAITMNTGMAIAGGRYGLAHELIAEIEANRRFYEGTCLYGCAAFFKAALAHARGDRQRAWRMLRETMAVSPAGIVRSNACLAAAWLACEDRALHEVQGWLDQVPAWTAEHPNGIMALARLRFEQGDWAAAVEHQARYVEHWPADEVTLDQRRLLQDYREAMRAGRAFAIPRLPHLLTLRF
jgi:tetratricopeptide (TPR) repeat protein